MLGRIRNILPGVGQGTSKPSQNAPALQKGGQAQAVGKRRALGDITNAHESQAVEAKEGKKVSFPCFLPSFVVVVSSWRVSGLS
jgi:hypothetical protein